MQASAGAAATLGQGGTAQAGRDHSDRPTGGAAPATNLDRRPDEECDETCQDIVMLEEIATVGGKKNRGTQQCPGGISREPTGDQVGNNPARQDKTQRYELRCQLVAERPEQVEQSRSL